MAALVKEGISEKTIQFLYFLIVKLFDWEEDIKCVNIVYPAYITSYFELSGIRFMFKNLSKDCF